MNRKFSAKNILETIVTYTTMPSKTIEDPVILDRYKCLAAGIIKQAASDLKTLPSKHPDRKSAVKFFQSRWFECLSDYLGIDSSQIRRVVV